MNPDGLEEGKTIIEWISDLICENKSLTEEVEELRSQLQSKNNKPRINACIRSNDEKLMLAYKRKRIHDGQNSG